jgi:type II secretory pathway pseudopilin PulG
MMRSGTKKNRKTLGFSLVETLIVVAVVLILLAAAIIQIPPVLRNNRASTGAAYVLNQIRVARERAIDERRLYQITFTAPRSILTAYQITDPVTHVVSFVPATGQPGQPNAGVIFLPYDVQFLVPATPPPAAPDGVGAQANALDFYCAGTACTGVPLYFYPDGSITNVNNDPIQGVVYTAMLTPGGQPDPLSSRAVSFFGPTGRAKSWRIRPASGTTTKWVQQ